jgi:cytochrome c-type biogenesis protein CcmH
MKHQERLAATPIVFSMIAAGFLAILGVSAILAPHASAATAFSPQAGDEALVQYAPQELEDTFQQLQTSIMSPYCQGLTLADCPTSGAVAMRERIHTWLEEGRSSEWIMNTLAGEYGEWIRSAPKFAGFGLLAWLAPGAALILGGVWVGGYMRRNTRPQEGAPDEVSRVEAAAPQQASSDEDARLREIEKRVEAELDAWQT